MYIYIRVYGVCTFYIFLRTSVKYLIRTCVLKIEHVYLRVHKKQKYSRGNVTYACE